MQLLLARAEINAKPVAIQLEEIEAQIKDENGKISGKIFYFDKDNAHKDLIALVGHFEERGLSVYHRVVKYGLEESEYMYEVHIL